MDSTFVYYLFSAILAVNSILNASALLQVREVQGTLNQFIKGTDKRMNDLSKRIGRLEEHYIK